ncbi:uncharacterized protein JCM6883_007086 [Sporobolomyces salmoneus]|uniref:uncharacterized protein n=1 Tax=Sporobolomyces salmoneus TaxID=183962 RepID=UPI00317FCB53
MSSCSFASFLQFRNNDYSPRSTHSHHQHQIEGPSSFAPLVSPLDLSSAPSSSSSSNPFSPTESNCSASSSSSGSDAASPHKRHRAHSPDSNSTTNSFPSLHSFSGEFGTSSFPFSYNSSSSSSAATLNLPSLDQIIASPQPTPLPVRSILCTSSSPTSSAADTPLSSPPPTRPVSRRSSTSKSVRFARCTNASVFPTHSTLEYDRSPIIPTCEAQSLELKRSCSAEGEAEGGGWIKCVEREKVAGAATSGTSTGGGGAGGAGLGVNRPKLPKNSPSMENPVEGVHGLIEGGFFVGEERDQPIGGAGGGVTTMTGVPGVGVITEDIELEDEALELEDEMLVDDSTETVDDDDDEDDAGYERDNEPDQDVTPRRGSIQDDSSASSSSSSSDEDIELPPSSAESVEPGGGGPYGSSSCSNASSSTSSISHQHRTRGDSSSPEMSATTVDEGDDSSDERERERERERVVKEEKALKKKQRFGLCSLGKYTRQDVFGTHDSLGGF